MRPGIAAESRTTRVVCGERRFTPERTQAAVDVAGEAGHTVEVKPSDD